MSNERNTQRITGTPRVIESQQSSGIYWPEFAYRLSLESSNDVDGNQILINIEVDKEHPGRFTYSVLSNKLSNNPEAYRGLEEKDNATTEEVIEMVYKFLAPELRLE